MAPTPSPLARGEAAYQNGKYDEAIALLTEAFDEDPKNPRVSCFLGLAWRRKGNPDQAIQHLTRAWDLAGHLPIVSDDPSLELLALARAHYKKGDYESTIVWAERGIGRDTNSALLHELLGDALYARKDYEKAATSYDTAIKLDKDHKAWPGSPGVIHKEKATALRHLKRYREALSAIEEAIRIEPTRASYHNWKGFILGDGLKDLDGAISAVRKAIDLDPEYGDSAPGLYHYNLAGYLADQGRYDEALVFANKAFSLDPSDAAYRACQKRISESVQKSKRGSAAGLRTFADIGGMKQLKEEIRRAMNVIHVARDKAKEYRIQKNGILFYGPPGCGKTALAEAIAGEFGLRFIRVSTATMLSKWIGEGAKNVEKVFEDASLQLPCVLFFDECEALLTRREDRSDVATVDAFLQAVDKYRGMPSLVLVAATNNIDTIDKAAIREGRFDYKVKIYKPDFEARLEMFKVKLEGRPTAADIDFFALADGTEGFSAARISQVVNNAAMTALEENAPISRGHLEKALEAESGKDRFEGRRLTWDDLIVSAETMEKLHFAADALLHPQQAAALGIDPPSGLLLYGPPGTGKTTIARVLASELKASFYMVTPADVHSKWVGESEQRVKEIFEKARDNRPSIVFMDEIDALLSRRDDGGGSQWRNSIVNLFLMEIDGLATVPGVFVLGATNRRDLLDEALLRPGRLSEQIEIPLPSEEERVRLFRLFTHKMALDADVDLGRLAAETGEFSGAEIESLCSNAGRNALVRVLESKAEPCVRGLDFTRALQERRRARGLVEPRRPRQASGTGWVVTQGYVVTCHHVVADAHAIELVYADQHRVPAAVVMSDPSNDLALLRPRDQGAPPPAALPLATSVTSAGERVFTVGYPLLSVLGSEAKVTEGIVSAVTGLGGDVRTLQISVPVHPGNSGGPLFNMRGEVVGVVVSKLNAASVFKWTGDIPQNVSYAIKAPYLQALLASAPTDDPQAVVPSTPATAGLVTLVDRARSSILLIIAK